LQSHGKLEVQTSSGGLVDVTALEPRLFAFDEFVAMGQPLGHFELVDGRVYVTGPRSDRQRLVCSAIHAALNRRIGSGGLDEQFLVVAGPTLRLSESTAVEPDLAVIDGPVRRYATEPISIERVRLVIEVAETSLAHDLGERSRRYAAAGIPEYWVVDVKACRVHALRSPTADGYSDATLHRNVQLASRAAAPLAIDVAGIFASTPKV
jgi:Uma2 family endonuclease